MIPIATNTPTRTPTPTATQTPTPTRTPTPTATVPPTFSSATFIYDGDGNRVKSIFNGTTNTYFVGNYYEVTGSVVTKYYYAGSQRIALRSSGTVYFVLGDHLGSTSLTTSATGTVVSELRYKAWGEVRYASGTTPTKYTFTGQYSYQSDFGLLFFNARWVDPLLGRFTQADAIVGYDRYQYGLNNPLRYTDPSGYVSCEGSNWDDGPNCEKKHPGIFTGCSVGYGVFNGRFTCTPDNLNGATIKQRKSWFNQMLASVDSTLVNQFTNLNGILDAFIKNDEGTPGSWTSWGDAGILNSIQNGLSLYKNGKAFTIDQNNPYSVLASNAWNTYFVSYHDSGANTTTLQNWGKAEGLSTSYGRLLAGDHGQAQTLGEILFLGVGDGYRTLLAHRLGPEATGNWPEPVSRFYNWIMDTSSTVGIPYTAIDFGVAPG